MLYLIYATLTAWLIMVIINYHSHKKYIVKHRAKFIKILEDNHGKTGSAKIDDKTFFSFTPDNIEKREFKKYLNMGKFKYILSDTTQIMFSIVFIFVIAYSLEYLPFVRFDRTSVDYHSVWQFVMAGYLICLIDAYSKTLKYDEIIKSWKKEKHPQE
jgi:hypothetical protein